MSELAIGSDTVIGFRYDLYDEAANRIESNRDGDPMLFLFGDRSVIAALQEAFRGKRAGDDFSVTIPHGQAYGRRYPDRTKRVPRKRLEASGGTRFRPGDVVSLPGERGATQATVIKAGKFQVDVDLNHPLAGHDLTFDILIESVRAALPDEIAHGHAHGPGGHHHA